jgi:hypothetical protein
LRAAIPIILFLTIFFGRSKAMKIDYLVWVILFAIGCGIV